MKQPSFDSPALATAMLAAAFVIFGAPGPFDWLNGVLSITLLSIIYAYEWDRPREKRQSWAFSAVSALCLLILVGLALELALGGPELEGKPNEFNPEQMDSRVKSSLLGLIWLGITPIFYAIDRNQQNKMSITASSSKRKDS